MEVVRAAHRRGLRVRALVRNERKLAPVRDCCFEVATVQVTEAETLRGALDGADFLVSALGKTYQSDKISRRAVDVQANLNLFAEAARGGVGRIGLVSVFTASPDHPSAMVRMKAEAEAGLRACGVPWVVVRPSGFFSDMYASLLDDANVGRAIDVGGPEVISSRDIAAMCGRVLGREVKVRSLPLWLAKTGVAMVRPFSRNRWEVGHFLVANADYARTHGGAFVAPKTGALGLEQYFRRRHTAEQAAAVSR